MTTAIKDEAELVSRTVEEAPTREPEAPPQPLAQAPTPTPAYLLPRTTNPLVKAMLKGPVLMWRLGLGRVLGRAVVIVTATGRKSGLPRHTPLGYSELNGRKYVFSLRGPETDWHRNIAANPHVTIQTADGNEPALARLVTGDEEIAAAYEFLAPMKAMQQWAGALGIELSREELIAHKDDFILIAFDPSTEPTPPPLKSDLVWVWPALGSVAAAGLLVYMVSRRTRMRAPEGRSK